MKKLFICIAFIGISLSVNSQIDKGIWLVGGTGSFYSYTEDYSLPTSNQTSKYTSVDIAASIGYFFVDKFVAGLRPSFSSYKGRVANTPAGNGTYVQRLSIGPFIRYYFLSKDKPFNVLFDGSYQIGTNRFLLHLHEKGKNNTLSIMGGSEIFFNSSVGMEILLGYTSKVLSIDDTQSASNNTKKGFQASIGFSFHLDKL